jgi:hypothetical protein
MDPEIHPAARRHRIADEDIRHAYRNPIRVFTHQGDGELTMHIGSATDGMTLLEVGFATSGDREVVVHAMPARPRYLK